MAASSRTQVLNGPPQPVVEPVAPVESDAILKCACGSGLRPARCCELQVGSIPLFEAGRHLVPLVERALQAYRHGSVETAERLVLDVLELAPNRPGALMLLYEIRKAQKIELAAEVLLRRVVTLDPNHLMATNELALLLMQKGNLAEAELHGRNAVRIGPDDAQAHNLLGMVFTEIGRNQFGEFHYRRAIELGGGKDAILMANLAWNLKGQDRIPEARELYAESLAIAPEVRQTLLGLARLEEADGKLEAATTILDKMEALFPGDTDAQLVRVAVLTRSKRHAEALEVLEALDRRTPGGLGPNELVEKGRVLDALGRFDEAFQSFMDGKRLAREKSGQVYQEDAAKVMTDRLRHFFDTPRLRLLPRAGVRQDVPQPIFILGFPRSGTTLVEQTLSSHPAVAAGDELPVVNDLTVALPRILFSPLDYPDALSELWVGDQRDALDRVRDYYLQRALRMVSPPKGKTWFTDKMPLNEMHLGLIGLTFPSAPLIHVLRHPLDVVVSALANQFTHGYFCSFSMDTIARHYVRVMDLVHHYRSRMTLRYLPIRYEDLVADQEPSVRAMLDFIGLDYDRHCLDFHRNPRHPRTPSYAQVTQPLNSSSVNRYRNYLRHLQPVIPVLEPVIRRLGYSIES